MIVNDQEKYITSTQFCEMFNISRSTFYKMKKLKLSLPKHIYIGKRKMVFSMNAINEWRKEQEDKVK